MRCPFCGTLDTKVIDSRLANEGDQVRRRRQCIACEGRFTTYENAELSLPRVVKRDGRREPFSSDKLRAGIMLACEKRPVPTERIEEIINSITHKTIEAGEREIESKRLGEWVMLALRTVDQVAYVRFASVYRSFEDVQAFREIIERVERDPTPEMLKSQLSLVIDETNNNKS